MPEYRKLLLDLDRTLFDTMTFADTLWSWLEQAYDIDATERAHMREFFRYVGEMYDYDFFAHMQSLGMDRQDVTLRAQQELDRAAFVYPDVDAFMDQTAELDRAILTFGNEPYQSFKLSFCPQLLELPVHITSGLKSQYIRENWPDGNVVLIDDKLQTDWPAIAKFIQLDRTQDAAIIEHDGYMTANSLTHVKKEWLQ